MRCVWVVACIFKLLEKDNKVDSSAAMFVCNVSEHTKLREEELVSNSSLVCFLLGNILASVTQKKAHNIQNTAKV